MIPSLTSGALKWCRETDQAGDDSISQADSGTWRWNKWPGHSVFGGEIKTTVNRKMLVEGKAEPTGVMLRKHRGSTTAIQHDRLLDRGLIKIQSTTKC